MTEIDLQKSFINRFDTLNTFSGKTFIKNRNVHYPNKAFNSQGMKSWFNLSFLTNPPIMASLGADAQNRYTGIFQIDIYTPLDVGEAESNNKYKWLSKLFPRDLYFDNISITRTYRAIVQEENDRMKTVVRVEFTADIDKEI